MTKPAQAACVIGHPIKHSRSPKIHGYWIHKYGLDAEYRSEDVTPEDFAAFVENLAERGYAGANVTMPHKDQAFALSDPDEAARTIGAANTLWLENGKLRATNTDFEGFINALDASAPSWNRRTSSAVVIGAGGAARAVIYGLIQRGVPRISVVNRTVEKAAALKHRFGPTVEPFSFAALQALLPECQLLVNATSLGMSGHPALEIDVGLLPDNGVVADIVYVPLQTPLLAAAAHRGLATSDGLEMLLHQAVRGFELWFGARPQVTRELYDLIAADINAG